jgi:hypothetical protein
VLRLVTSGANFNLGGRGLHGIFGGVQIVATRAGDIARCVGARCPIVRRVRLMTGQTLAVLLCSGRLRFRAEIHHALEWTATRLYMRTAGSVTRLALQAAMPKRAMRVIGSGMLGAEDTGDRGIIVTPEAGIGALRTVGRIDVRWTTDLRCNGDLWWRIGCHSMQTCGQEQNERGGYTRTRKPTHLISRSRRRNVVHDGYIRNATRTVANATGLHVRRVSADNRAPFSVFGDRSRTTVLLHVGLREGIGVTPGAYRHIRRGGDRVTYRGRVRHFLG